MSSAQFAAEKLRKASRPALPIPSQPLPGRQAASSSPDWSGHQPATAWPPAPTEAPAQVLGPVLARDVLPGK